MDEIFEPGWRAQYSRYDAEGLIESVKYWHCVTGAASLKDVLRLMQAAKHKAEVKDKTDCDNEQEREEREGKLADALRQCSRSLSRYVEGLAPTLDEGTARNVGRAALEAAREALRLLPKDADEAQPQEPTHTVPAGWALVPVNPPDLLLNSFLTGYGGGAFNAMHLRDRVRRGYRQMLESIPLAEERGILTVPKLGEHIDPQPGTSMSNLADVTLPGATLNVDDRRKLVQATMIALQQMQREPATMDAIPLKDNAGVHDYAEPLQWMATGLAAMDEALPLGQKQRAELGFILVETGVRQLRRWLSAKGYAA